MGDVIAYYAAILTAGIIRILISWALAGIITCIAPGYFQPTFYAIALIFITEMILRTKPDKGKT